MPAIGIRDLLRDAKTVFERIEKDQEPVLITRRGRPFAALVPVDPENAEALILSSAPELVESRRRAENARAEGRTTSLEDALNALDDDDPAAEEDDGIVSARSMAHVDAIHEPLPALAHVFGVERAEEVAKTATQRVERFTRKLLEDAVDTHRTSPAEIDDLVATMAALNEHVVKLRLRRAVARNLRAVAAISGGSATNAAPEGVSAEGLLGYKLADAAVDEATEFVDSLVARNIEVSKHDGWVSPGVLKATMTATVGVLEQADQL